MLRISALRFSAFAQVRKTYGCKAVGGASAWFSGASPLGSSDDPTPAETKLAFSSTEYGKDPAAAVELDPSQAALTEELKQSAATLASTHASSSRGNDPRAMFDSSLAQQAEDGKTSGAIKRDVATETPDATRVAFGFMDYGKDPSAAAVLSEQDTSEMESLQCHVGNTARSVGTSAAPLHDDRNLFDSDLTQGAGTVPTAESIKRDVSTDTPDATRVAFRTEVYGKDPQGSAELSEQEVAEVKAFGARATHTAGRAAPVHHDRNMFDSELVHGVGNMPPSESIKREVGTDTPETTRLVFGGSDYGKDPQSMVRTPEEQAEMDDLAAKIAGRAGGEARTAPIHHPRSMFDSDLTHNVGGVMDPDTIKRDVSGDTPDTTRLVFGGSDYGKDPKSMARTSEEQARMDDLATHEGAMNLDRRRMAPIHHSRSMFDSDLTQGAGGVQGSDAIKRDVAPDTPELTRLSFFGSTYGDAAPVEDIAETAEELAKKQAKGTRLMAVGCGARRSKVHDTKRAMKDDDYTQAGAE